MNVATNHGAFEHGPSPCRTCFSNKSVPWNSVDKQEFAVAQARWRIRANPAYWGSANPEILVLGFSKGPGQIQRLNAGERFEAIPFNDAKGRMRPNLKRLLAEIGVLDLGASLSALFLPTEKRFGFASLVRCSVEVLAGEKWAATSGNILAKTISARPTFLTNCARQHVLSALPPSVRVVVMLGTDRTYVREMMKLLHGVPVEPGRDVNYAYRAMERTVVHLPHPSGGNSGSVAVFCGDRPPNPNEVGALECRKQVMRAIAMTP